MTPLMDNFSRKKLHCLLDVLYASSCKVSLRSNQYDGNLHVCLWNRNRYIVEIGPESLIITAGWFPLYFCHSMSIYSIL